MALLPKQTRFVVAVALGNKVKRARVSASASRECMCNGVSKGGLGFRDLCIVAPNVAP
jgi:hypothetical protein